MLPYHFKATNLPCNSVGRNNTAAWNSTAKCFSKPSRGLLLRGPIRNQGGARWSGCSALLDHRLQRACSQGRRWAFTVWRCISEHVINNLQGRSWWNHNVSALLVFVSRGWVLSSHCWLVCLWTGFALVNWRVSSLVLRIKSLLSGPVIYVHQFSTLLSA